MTDKAPRTVIFPVAGLGTRFLPATKATPKELLPVIDTPLIQYAIDEARDAGVERMIFVSHPSKAAIERYVRMDSRLDATLRERGKTRLAEELGAAALDNGDHEVLFVMQDRPLGLGHAVLQARDHVLPGPVAVVLPDDLILGDTGCLSQMVGTCRTCDAGHLVAAMPVPRNRTGSYGILSPLRRDGAVTHADGMVEKPAPDRAPSTLAVVGRYILDASIFDDLAAQAPGAGGEIQLTDAIARGVRHVGLAGFAFEGRRFDCGSKQGMLAATLALAMSDPDCAEVLQELAAGMTCGTSGAVAA